MSSVRTCFGQPAFRTMCALQEDEGVVGHIRDGRGRNPYVRRGGQADVRGEGAHAMTH